LIETQRSPGHTHRRGGGGGGAARLRRQGQAGEPRLIAQVALQEQSQDEELAEEADVQRHADEHRDREPGILEQ